MSICYLGDTDAAEPPGAKGSSVVLVFSPLITLMEGQVECSAVLSLHGRDVGSVYRLK